MPSFSALTRRVPDEAGRPLSPTGTGQQEALAGQVRGFGQQTRELLAVKQKLDQTDNAIRGVQAVNEYRRQARNLEAEAISSTGLDSEAYIAKNDELLRKWESELETYGLDSQTFGQTFQAISNVYNPTADRITSHAYSQKGQAFESAHNESLDAAAENMALAISTFIPDEIDENVVDSLIHDVSVDLNYTPIENLRGAQSTAARKEADKAVIVAGAVGRLAQADPEGTVNMLKSGKVNKYLTTEQRDELVKRVTREQSAQEAQAEKQLQKDKDRLDRDGLNMLFNQQYVELNEWVTNNPEVIAKMDRGTRAFYYNALASATKKDQKGDQARFDQYKSMVYRNPHLFQEAEVYDLPDINNDQKTDLVDIIRKQQDPNVWPSDKRILWKDVQKTIDSRYKQGEFGSVNSDEAIAEMQLQKDAAFDYIATSEDVPKAAQVWNRISAEKTVQATFGIDFINPDEVVAENNRAKLQRITGLERKIKNPKELRSDAIADLVRNGVPVYALDEKTREEAITSNINQVIIPRTSEELKILYGR